MTKSRAKPRRAAPSLKDAHAHCEFLNDRHADYCPARVTQSLALPAGLRVSGFIGVDFACDAHAVELAALGATRLRVSTRPLRSWAEIIEDEGWPGGHEGPPARCEWREWTIDAETRCSRPAYIALDSPCEALCRAHYDEHLMKKALAAAADASP